jgi:hypothetical protein
MKSSQFFTHLVTGTHLLASIKVAKRRRRYLLDHTVHVKEAILQSCGSGMFIPDPDPHQRV